MKTALLATVAILALAGPARAQIPVTDGLSIATRAADAALDRSVMWERAL
jgi:hypothetical protein